VHTGSMAAFIIPRKKGKASEFLSDLLLKSSVATPFRTTDVQGPASLVFSAKLCTASVTFSPVSSAECLVFTRGTETGPGRKRVRS
jgi:hypothetical protein